MSYFPDTSGQSHKVRELVSMRARALTSMPTLFYSKKNRVGVLTSARAPALTSTQT